MPLYIVNLYTIYFKEEVEDAKSVNRRRTGKHNGEKNKSTNNDLQNTTQKTKYRVARPPSPQKRQKQKQKNTTQATKVEIRYCNQSI